MSNLIYLDNFRKQIVVKSERVLSCTQRRFKDKSPDHPVSKKCHKALSRLRKANEELKDLQRQLYESEIDIHKNLLELRHNYRK